jgi:hypothetical protein
MLGVGGLLEYDAPRMEMGAVHRRVEPIDPTHDPTIREYMPGR